MKNNISVLIVDDNQGMRETLTDILEDEGYHVNSVDSGEEAIEIVKKQSFDVILMDVRMPGINGIEAYREMRTYTGAARYIMMSAYSLEELRQHALEEGAIAFLQKPLDIEKVLQIIQKTEQLPVLIVMNDQEERKKLLRYLDEHQYRAYVTESAEYALELALQIRFHLVMIDTRLTRMTGLELYLALKRITPTSVTIMLSETDEKFVKQAEEAVKHSAYTFLKKPLDLDKLFTILSLIRRQRYSDFIQKP